MTIRDVRYPPGTGKIWWERLSSDQKQAATENFFKSWKSNGLIAASLDVSGGSIASQRDARNVRLERGDHINPIPDPNAAGEKQILPGKKKIGASPLKVRGLPHISAKEGEPKKSAPTRATRAEVEALKQSREESTPLLPPSNAPFVPNEKRDELFGRRMSQIFVEMMRADRLISKRGQCMFRTEVDGDVLGRYLCDKRGQPYCSEHSSLIYTPIDQRRKEMGLEKRSGRIVSGMGYP